MPKARALTTDEKFDKMIDLLKYIVAIELAREGVKRSAIAKHLGVANATVTQMLKGVGKDD